MLGFCFAVQECGQILFCSSGMCSKSVHWFWKVLSFCSGSRCEYAAMGLNLSVLLCIWNVVLCCLAVWIVLIPFYG